MPMDRRTTTPACLFGLGILLVSLIFMASCSLEWPIAPTGDENLDQRTSLDPQLLHRPSGVAEYASGDALTLYAEQWIGIKGGALVIGDDLIGYFKLEVVPGALKQELLVTMRVPLYGEIIVDFGPEGIVFHKPCTVELSYRGADLTGVHEDRICAWYLDEIIPRWEYMGGEVDRKRKVVQFHVDHFSRYGLAPRRR